MLARGIVFVDNFLSQFIIPPVERSLVEHLENGQKSITQTYDVVKMVFTETLKNKEEIVQNRLEVNFELCFQHKTILLSLTNRLVPKVSENPNKKLVKINRKVNEFRKMQFSRVKL